MSHPIFGFGEQADKLVQFAMNARVKPWECKICGKKCKSTRGLSIHKTRKHLNRK